MIQQLTPAKLQFPCRSSGILRVAKNQLSSGKWAILVWIWLCKYTSTRHRPSLCWLLRSILYTDSVIGRPAFWESNHVVPIPIIQVFCFRSFTFYSASRTGKSWEIRISLCWDVVDIVEIWCHLFFTMSMWGKKGMACKTNWIIQIISTYVIHPALPSIRLAV